MFDRYSKLIVVLTLVAIVLLAYSAHNIRFERGLETYLSKDSKTYIHYKLYTKNFKAYEKVFIFIKAEDVVRKDVFEYMLKLERELKEIDGVGDVVSPASIVYGMLGNIPNDRNELYRLAKDSGLIISPSFAMMIVSITTSEEEKLETIAKQIERIVEFLPKPAGLNVQMTGSVFLWYQIKKEMGKSLGIMTSASTLLMVLILFFTFRSVVRRLSFAFLPLLISVFSVIAVFGLMPILGIPMTELTHGALPILIGLSIDYAVQLQNRFEEERRKSDVLTSIKTAINKTGMAIFLALITSVLCFSSMAFCGVPGLSYFGFLLSLGLTIAFILTLTFLPSILYLFDSGGKWKKAELLESALSRIAEVSVRRRSLILAFVIMIVFAGAYCSQNIGMEIQHKKYAPQDLPAIILFKELERVAGGQSTFVVVLSDADGKIDEFVKFMEKRGFKCSVRSVGSQTAIYLSTKLEKYEDYKRAYDEIDGALRFFGFTDYYITGNPVLDMETGRLMIEGQMNITMISFGLIVILLLLIYRSIRKAIVPLIPIVTVIGLMNILMFLLRIKHTMMSITLNSIIIGLGVDYSIHIVERFFEELRKVDPAKAIKRTIERTGRAITISALTTAGGFFALMFSRFPIAKSAGFLSFSAIILCLITSLTVVPAFLMITEKFKAARE